ncbi:glycoside hydrolase family 3 N-terminal domain-containing protein [Plantactinospora soyae]|uniref:beta-N-acetylhexosaminidase n=1 Tax=Plantactinospora soyae TaxID=1544732 RepID=A0A927MBK3_9ACTN|nr:glycoside hydrolase family 3 N-terminal domain-containing protein [Plantactinospora soyae]MBE1491449.1 beta-N-acetylhexosaminidase [Plantactinospora soyae]
MKDARLPRRLLLTGVGATAVVAALPGCGAGTSKAPAPQTAGSPTSRPPTRSRSGGEATLRRKIASLLVVGFRGEKLAGNDWIMKAVRNGLGGIILFDRDLKTNAPRNITSPAQVTALVKSLRQAAPGRLLVSIDQEGGQVSRLNPGNGFPATRSQAEIGAANSTPTTRTWAQQIAHSLTSIGVNLNYAPVVDLNLNPGNPAVGKLGRSFSANPDVVIKNATEEVQVHRAAGVRTALKHFPGLGTATGNTDFAVVDVSKTWQTSELEPFQRMIEGGNADSILVAHLLNKQLDPSRPASLSPAIVTDLLRGRLGWKGAVVSDDMQAVAISSKYGRDEAVAMALEAGVDVLVFANQQVYDPKIVDETVDNVVNLVRKGRLTEARIDQSVARVDALRPKR